jgi:hypothetical protein
MSSDDVRLKPCEHCQSEGRIIRAVSRHWGLEPKDEDCGECPVCEGTGMEMIEVESIDLHDLCRNGGCQYGMAPEYTCRHECQYKRANSKQETVSDERDGAVAERSAARSEHQRSVDDTILARRIMTLCGCSPASPSLEPDACPITDAIAIMLAAIRSEHPRAAAAGGSYPALEACPFCGGPSIVAEKPSKTGWRVMCHTDCDIFGDFDTREEAIAAWNRRPPPLVQDIPIPEGGRGVTSYHQTISRD